EDAFQARAQLIEAGGTGAIPQPGWTPCNEWIQRKKAVEPKNSVLYRSENRTERRIHSAAAYRCWATSGGHLNQRPGSPRRAEAVLIESAATVYTPHRKCPVHPAFQDSRHAEPRQGKREDE